LAHTNCLTSFLVSIGFRNGGRVQAHWRQLKE